MSYLDSIKSMYMDALKNQDNLLREKLSFVLAETDRIAKESKAVASDEDVIKVLNSLIKKNSKAIKSVESRGSSESASSAIEMYQIENEFYATLIECMEKSKVSEVTETPNTAKQKVVGQIWINIDQYALSVNLPILLNENEDIVSASCSDGKFYVELCTNKDPDSVIEVVMISDLSCVAARIREANNSQEPETQASN